MQTKFRDEARPRGGLLRCREFIMKDAYSFHATDADARHGYELMRRAYCAIFERVGLECRMVQADSGAMGGAGSAEFQALADGGEDQLLVCSNCDYAANLEVAAAAPLPALGPDGPVPAAELVHTPAVGSIEDVSRFLQLPPERFLKSLLYVAGSECVLAIVRGDHTLQEVKLARALGVGEVRLASAAEVEQATHAALGFAGPKGFQGRVVIDRDAASVRDAVSGANVTDHHLLHVVLGRDFEAQLADIREVVAGDGCTRCGAPLSAKRGIEAGHIFLLGTRYTAAMGATFLDDAGQSKPIVAGCYGIGVSRLVAALVEQHHDEHGIRWPAAVAPYDVHVVALGGSSAVQAATAELEAELERAGLEVLVDDRDERPGAKFKDADLVGVPLRVTIGDKSLAQGAVELKLRSERDPRRVELLPLAEAASALVARVRPASPRSAA
ncbi:MAG: proline--tRNA ligase [Polyangiaceae bacterium]